LAGKPTVRKAQLPSGNRMTKKPTPAAETHRETGTRWRALHAAVWDNRPDTDPWDPARKGADVVRWTPKTTMTTTPQPMDKLDAAAMAAVSGPADDSFPVERIVGPCVIRPDGPARAGCGEKSHVRFLGGPALRGAGPTRPKRSCAASGPDDQSVRRQMRAFRARRVARCFRRELGLATELD
jgi:hypothetical protein